MSGPNLDDDSWPVWRPVSGGLTDVDSNHTTPPEDGLPVMATNDRGEFIRSEFAGMWHRCDWAGRPNGEPLPGLFKLRVHLGDGVHYTTVCAPLLVYELPNVGTFYRKITEIWEMPDGAVRVAGTWTVPGLTGGR